MANFGALVMLSPVVGCVLLGATTLAGGQARSDSGQCVERCALNLPHAARSPCADPIDFEGHISYLALRPPFPSAIQVDRAVVDD